MATPNTSTSNVSSTPTMPTATRVPHMRVRLGRSKNVIYSTYQHVIELYGPQMPVLVAESLHYMPGAKTTASVNINFETAWAWYVCNRKLLVWHIPSYTDSGLTVIAKEMLLPSSDLAHHANLVVIYNEPNQAAPSCIAVSPEGVIRYWEIIGHHSTWVDVNANLGGEEVCEVHYIPPIGCLAVTTSGTMIIITPTVVRGNATVSTRHVSQLSGWLGHLGRRVSSIIFGGSNPAVVESKTVKLLTSVRAQGFWSVLMLDGFNLHSWVIQVDGLACHHKYDCNIEPLIRSVFPEEVSENPECELLITDVRPSDGGSIIVLAVSSEPRHYVIVELNGDDLEVPDVATKLCTVSRDNLSVLEGPDGNLANLKFLLLPTTALVFNNLIIYAVPLSAGEECDGEPLDLPGGVVLGGLMHKTTPVFFSATYGFVSVTPVDTACIDVINTSIADSRVTPHSIVAREPVASTTVDYVYHIKIAFVHYIRKNLNQCIHVLKREFPCDENEPAVDSVLAKTLVKISLDIINDVSPKDHRWGEIKEGLKFSSTKSLHLDTQLAEKMQAHDVFLCFAKEISSSINLGMVTRKGNPVRTIHILYEHNEKIVACIMLKKLQVKYPRAVGYGIGVATNAMNFVSTPQLSCYDFFYRYTSISDEALKAIMTKCIRLSIRNIGSAKFMKLLYVTNQIMLAVINALYKVRAKRGYFIDVRYVPWLSAPEPTGIFDHLSALANVTHDAVCRFGRHTRRFRRLTSQFYLLCNALMYLRFEYVDISEFNAMSSSFIQFFLDFKMYKHALLLAFKFKNFEYLVKLSYMMQMENQIPKYIESFGDEGFCFYLFRYLYLEGKFSDLLNLELPEKYIDQLEMFLAEIPTIDWLYKLKKQRYLEANKVLLDLGEDENSTLQEQEVMYSIAKLTALAASSDDALDCALKSNASGSSNTETYLRLIVENDLVDVLINGTPAPSLPPESSAGDIPNGSSIEDLINDMNLKLEIILAQKRIPRDAFTRKGYDIGSLRMLPPSELIELYTGDTNFEANEIAFKRALDLLPLISDSAEHDALRKKIWRRAIKRDDWGSIRKDAEPDDVVENLLFFKFMKLVKATCSGEDTSVIIPAPEEFLDDPELQIFTKDSLCYYLLEYGYEAVMGTEEVGIIE